jgi:GntR family transcriptional regulator
MDINWIALKPDETSPTPLYIQVAQRFEEAIRQGRWHAEEALPSERVISEALSLSRVTARKALDVLIEQGLIRRRQGSGTFINALTEYPLSRLTSFTELLKERGFQPSSAWLERDIVTASDDEVIKLGLSPGAQVSRLKRQRLADGVVIAIEQSSLPLAYLPDPRAVDNSLYDYLETLGHPVVRALQHIRAINAPEEIARLAGIKAGDAMLFITRVGYTKDNASIELTDSWCRSDYYDFVAELKR